MKIWKVGGVFHFRFQVGGKRIQKSTGTKIKGQAEAIAIQALQDAKLRAQGVEPIPTLGGLRQSWLEAHAAAVGPGHWRNVNDWDDHGLDGVKIDRLSTELVEMAREKHRKGRSAETVAGWMRIINLLVNWAIKRKLIPAKPYDIKTPKPQKKPKAVLPLAMVKAWVDAIDAHARNPQVGTAVRLMVGLGLRESEALGARWEWINWANRTYTPGRLVDGVFKTKGKEAVPVDLPDWLYDHLLALKGEEARLGLILPWRALDDGTEVPHPANFTRRSMAAANADLGTPGVTAHRTRGTWITHLLRLGTPLPEVQGMARHKSKQTTLGYYEESSEVRKEAQKKLADGMGF